MDKRVIRRFGRARKNLSFGKGEIKGDNGWLTYTSYNGKWKITVRLFTEDRRPYAGRIINCRNRLIDYWFINRKGELVCDMPSLIPAYVEWAIRRICNVGTDEIGKRSQRRLRTVRRATR